MLFCGDRLDFLLGLNEKAQLIVTSPPYNTGKEYEQVTSLEAYVSDQEKTIAACVAVLQDTGSICWQVGHYIDGSGKSKEAFPLDLVLYPIFKMYNMKLRNRIVWTFGHGLHDRVRFSGRHETILWFTRDTEDYVFNLDPVRVPQKYPNKKHFKGVNRGKLSCNPLGKNPGDVWDIPNVKSNHVEKTEHPCQFPVGLVERLILSLTNVGDLVVDPYIGSGTTAVAALLHNRRVVGCDVNPKYIEIAQGRIRDTFDGSIKIRPMNKSVYGN